MVGMARWFAILTISAWGSFPVVAVPEAWESGAAIFNGVEWQPLLEIEPPVNSAPVLPVGDAHIRNDTSIFINVAAFRDGKRCGATMFSLLSKARYPARVRIGLLQQNQAGDSDCEEELCQIILLEGAVENRNSTHQQSKELHHSCAAYTDRITTKRVDASQAKGPVTARASANLLRPREADAGFCLQVDSHMLAAQDWDVGLVDQWTQTKNEKAVLSTYVPDLKELVDPSFRNARNEVPVICRLAFNKDDMPRNVPATNAMRLSKPKLSTLWAAGFSFSKCHADAVVPYDPHLPQIFDGEEFSRAARLWTHGYDFYAPSVSYIFHNYTGSSLDLGWQNPRTAGAQELAKSKARLWTLLRMPGGSPSQFKSLGPFGLGSARTLRQYESFVGINLAARVTLDPERGKCGDVRYVKLGSDSFVDELNGAYATQEDEGIISKEELGDEDGENCGTLVAPVQHTGGQGGFTAQCHNLGTMTYSECETALLSKPCGAMTYRADGKCSLHDTERGGFGTDAAPGALLVVKTPAPCKAVSVVSELNHHPPAKTYYRSAHSDAAEGRHGLGAHEEKIISTPRSSRSASSLLLFCVVISAIATSAARCVLPQPAMLGCLLGSFRGRGQQRSMGGTYFQQGPSGIRGHQAPSSVEFDYETWSKHL